MKIRKITAGGQLSIPSTVRRRWRTSRVAIEDRGDHLVLKPIAEDPIAAARGAFRGRIASTTDLRSAARRDDAEAERRRK
jgi:bifunctional DNA-binding transcriptional regulator/antitoxin component of YhaV-PrlF toxin-antitoxin module